MRLSSVGQVPVAYEVTGTGAPLVFVHGLASDHHAWDAQVAMLSQNYRTIAVDLPGHGNARGNSLPDKNRFVDGVRGAVRSITGGRVTLAGWSLGGQVAIDYACRFPSEVAGVILIDHNAGSRRARTDAARAGRPDRRDDPIAQLLDAGDFDAARAAIVESWIGGGEPDIDSLRTTLTDMAFGTDGEVIRAIRGLPWTSTTDLSSVRAPALTIHGGASKLGGQSSADYLASNLRECRVLLVEGHGHAVQISAPDTVNEAVSQFMERVDRG